jgi:hypothetical protein
VAADASQLAAEFGVLTKSNGNTRRRALGVLAKRHGLAPNRVYEMIEASKKSVK